MSAVMRGSSIESYRSDRFQTGADGAAVVIAAMLPSVEVDGRRAAPSPRGRHLLRDRFAGNRRIPAAEEEQGGRRTGPGKKQNRLVPGSPVHALFIPCSGACSFVL